MHQQVPKVSGSLPPWVTLLVQVHGGTEMAQELSDLP